MEESSHCLGARHPVFGINGEGDPVRAGGGCHEIPYGVNEATTATVSIEECKYVPTVVRIDAGDSSSGRTKTTCCTRLQESLTAGAISRSTSRVARSPTPSPRHGVFPYFCELHPGMVGAVVVGDGVGAARIPETASLRSPRSPRGPAGAGCCTGRGGNKREVRCWINGVGRAGRGCRGAVLAVAGFTLVRRTRGA